MKIYQVNINETKLLGVKIFWFLDHSEYLASISLYHTASSNSYTTTKGLGFRVL